jgi:hypothetical protein
MFAGIIVTKHARQRLIKRINSRKIGLYLDTIPNFVERYIAKKAEARPGLRLAPTHFTLLPTGCATSCAFG